MTYDIRLHIEYEDGEIDKNFFHNEKDIPHIVDFTPQKKSIKRIGIAVAKPDEWDI